MSKGLTIKIIDQLFNGGNHTNRTLLKSKWGLINFLKDMRDLNRNGQNWKNMINNQIESMIEEEKHIKKLLKEGSS